MHTTTATTTRERPALAAHRAKIEADARDFVAQVWQEMLERRASKSAKAGTPCR